ncbi:MAG: polysaccharide deacetylase family protein [Kiritimatiellae bacterium]|nr:polysaccharide deacetylase family protein [Kiritimatiellia bacterium]
MRCDRSEGLPTFYFTLDVEPDYARTNRHALLDRLPELLSWLRGEAVPLTAFVVGRYFEEGRDAIDHLLDAGADVGVHGHWHRAADFGTMYSAHTEEIERGTAAFRRRVGRAPKGYRSPSGVISRDDLALLARLNYCYDASVFPVRRPGRYDFSRAPRAPFRWKDSQLLELPCGLLTRRLPAGMTFLNWVGAGWGGRLLARQVVAQRGHQIFDAHLHNLFHSSAALRELPLGLRGAYEAGRVFGGLKCLQALVAWMRKSGWRFGSLDALADELNRDAGAVPTAGWDEVIVRATARASA